MEVVFDHYWTTGMLLRYLKISYTTMRRLIVQKKLKPLTIEKRRFFDINQVKEYLNSLEER